MSEENTLPLTQESGGKKDANILTNFPPDIYKGLQIPKVARPLKRRRAKS